MARHLDQAARALEQGNEAAVGRALGTALGHLQRAADGGDPQAAALFEQLRELIDSAEPTELLTQGSGDADEV